MTSRLAAVLALGLCACNLTGNVSFAEARTYYSFIGRPMFADIDGDGDVDILVEHTAGGASLSLLTNDGSGSFSIKDDIAQIDARLFVDVNGDGRADVVGPDWLFPGDLEVGLSNGDGTFKQVRTPVKVPMSVDTQFTAADTDGDGYPEIVVANSSQTVVLTLAIDGTVTNEVSLGAGVLVPTPDVDGDRAADWYKWSAGSLAVSSEHGTWTTSLTAYERPSVRFSDIDGDGVLDLLVAACESGRRTLHVLAFRGNGDGTFVAQSDTVMSSAEAQFDDFVDADGDGIIDVAFRNLESNDVEQFASGTASFAFGASTYSAKMPETAQYVQFADVNNDGRPDIVEKSNFMIEILASQ